MQFLSIFNSKAVFIRFFSLLFLLLSSICCQSATDKPVVDPTYILKNVRNYLSYNAMYLKLSESFVALDVTGKVITKERFFQQIMTDKFIPVRLKSTHPSYQLYRISSVGDPMIPRLIGSLGKLYYTYLKMEGQKIPSLKLTDINGHSYNPANTKGKIIVMKFWYTTCVMCVKEMPELNDLVDTYKSNKNVEFISLAFNDAPKLRKFLKEHRFIYPIIPNMESYAEKLKIPAYPTHLIVRDGKIIKAVGSAHELIAAMKTEIRS